MIHMGTISETRNLRSVILFLFALVVVSLFMATKVSAAGTGKTAQQAMKYQDSLIKSQVETAVSMLSAIYAKHKNGELSLEQAKKLGADLLRELRYGDNGYFWADTVDGVNVVLYSRKDVEGRNRLEDKDLNGTFYVKEFLTKGKQPGGGYTEYWFPKMGGKEPFHKRSYTLLFEPFGWIVGTGYYSADLRAASATMYADPMVEAAARLLESGIGGMLAGTVSMLLKQAEMIRSVAASVEKEFGVMSYVMQHDGVILYDTDAAQIGLNILTDPCTKTILNCWPEQTDAVRTGGGENQ